MTNNQTLAHRCVTRAILNGRLKPAKKMACVNCGSGADLWHHEDYSPDKWLDVEPLCRGCHGIRHAPERGRLTYNDVVTARNLRAMGATITSIAKMFDYDISSMDGVIKGYFYRWVDYYPSD